MVERHKPSNEVRAATHPALGEDYKKLASHVTTAIVNKCRDIVIRFPYFVELDPTFPRGVLFKKDSMYNYHRCKVFKLADWLCERGFMPTNAKETMKSMRTVNNLMGEIDRLVEQPHKEFLQDHKILLDSENEIRDNSNIEFKENT